MPCSKYRLDLKVKLGTNQSDSETDHREHGQVVRDKPIWISESTVRLKITRL